eukprot:scaffold584_cov338-Pavlova_lutheri.AAC.44
MDHLRPSGFILGWAHRQVGRCVSSSPAQDGIPSQVFARVETRWLEDGLAHASLGETYRRHRRRFQVASFS